MSKKWIPLNPCDTCNPCDKISCRDGCGLLAAYHYDIALLKVLYKSQIANGINSLINSDRLRRLEELK
jgi:hypothetical protein